MKKNVTNGGAEPETKPEPEAEPETSPEAEPETSPEAEPETSPEAEPSPEAEQVQKQNYKMIQKMEKIKKSSEVGDSGMNFGFDENKTPDAADKEVIVVFPDGILEMMNYKKFLKGITIFNRHENKK